ncbi:hypothetical protein P7C73_g980, partial [Tremellales sp. Uapishka_1]
MAPSPAHRVWAIPTLRRHVLSCLPDWSLKSMLRVSSTCFSDAVQVLYHTTRFYRYQFIMRARPGLNRLCAYIEAIRSLDMRGHFALILGVNGLPHLIQIFPRLNQLITSSSNIVIKHTKDKSRPTILIEKRLVFEPDFFMDAIPSEHSPNLPMAWDAKYSYHVLSLWPEDVHSVDDGVFLDCGGPNKDGLPSILNRQVSKLRIWTLDQLDVTTDLLEQRASAGLPPIEDLDLICDGYDLVQLSRFISSMRSCRKLSLDVDFSSTRMPVPKSLFCDFDWSSMKGLKALAIAIHSSPRREICFINGSTWCSHQACPIAPEPISGPHHRARLDLISFTLHLSAFPYRPDKDDRELLKYYGEYLSSIPQLSSLASAMFDIGGPGCEYHLTVTSKIPAAITELSKCLDTCLTGLLRKEIASLIEKENGKCGWTKIEKVEKTDGKEEIGGEPVDGESIGVASQEE